ncbi:MAG: hypothetical protein LBM59_04015 [Ruminococcus sp.]|jgi:hypothetical protein|nr:hypothetical protein [Ruminococcus sp.]
MKKITVVVLAIGILLCSCNTKPTSFASDIMSVAMTSQTTTVTKETTTTAKLSETETVPLETEIDTVTEIEEVTTSEPIVSKITLPQNEYVYGDSGLFITSDYDKNTTTIYNTDGRYIQTKDSMEVWNDHLDYSLDKKEAAYIQSVGYQLFYISAEKMEPVFIDYHAQFFKMALSGNAIAYTDSQYTNAYLYLWDGSEKTLITKKCYDPENFLISPDGKTVLYQEKVNQTVKAYLYSHGNLTFIEDDIEPLAITDNGIVYYIKSERLVETLYVQKGDDAENRLKLHEIDDSVIGDDYVFNKDLSELICVSGDEVFIIKDGKLVNSFTDKYRNDNHFFPDSIAIEVKYLPVERKNFRAFGTDTFSGTFYIKEDRNLYCFDEDFNLVKVFDGVMNNRTLKPIDYKLSRGGEILTVKLNNKMFRYEITDPNSLYEYDVPHKIEFIIPAADGNSIYYFTEDYKLYYMKPNEEPLLLISDLEEYDDEPRENNYCAIINNNEMYFLNGGTIYYTDGSVIKKQASGFSSLNFYNGVIILSGKNSDSVVTKDGKIIDSGGLI